ncbi:MAG: IMP dehydrogenase [Verrucomicrobiota bacterium]
MGDPVPVALSFDDVLLQPGKSDIIPAEADLRTKITSNIALNIPIVSSAMDTVTESGLAIALAREGGFGVVHRACPIDEQVNNVAKVKRSENTVIREPFTVTADLTLKQLHRVMDEQGVSGFPVVDTSNKLVGMITSRDIWYVEDESVTIAEMMTPRDRLITGKKNTTQAEARRILYENRLEKIPLVDEDDRLAGLITGKDIEIRKKYTNAAKDPNGQLRVGAAVGVGDGTMERARELLAAGADALFIDAATGHTLKVLDLIGKLREMAGERPVVAGNVVTEEGAKDLVSAGANAVKVGVGPGSICTTRVISGVGMAQFTAIQNVAPYCREKGIPVIADGGIRYSGDMVKALAAGADCVMLGSLLAGTREAPGAMVNFQGRTFKEYRGMGSLKAMRKGAGDRYGQNSAGKLVAEGVEARVPYRGRLAETVFQLLGGLRSGMGYVGAHNLAELRERARFVQITSGGLKESHPHDVMVTEEPVNYQSLD